MRESVSIFQKGLAVGLPPSPYYNTQAEYLSQCYNLVPASTGVEAREEIYSPSLDFPSRPWPYPALYRTSRYNFIFLDDQIILWDGDSGTTTIKYSKNIGLPHIADFMDTVIFSTQDAPYIFTRPDRLSEDVAGATFRTCCNFKGQLVVGDCTIPKGPRAESCQEPTYDIQVSGPDIVAWSKIGQLDWEYTLGNEVGWVSMPWQGRVLKLIPMRDEIVVYCENGIAKLRPVTEPTQTFGILPFGNIGVLSRDCVAGGNGGHLFIGTDYELYLVQPERALSTEGRAVKLLGYSHLIKNLTNPVVTYDSVRGHWWIAGEDKCYIYTGYGLGESSLSPTNLNNLEGLLWSYCHGSGVRNAIIETSPLSFNYRGIKTVMNVEADVEAKEKVYGIGSWKSDYRQSFRHRQSTLLDPRGSFFPLIAGSEIKILLHTNEFQDFILSKLIIHFKSTDKTFSRGAHNANTSPEQADS